MTRNRDISLLDRIERQYLFYCPDFVVNGCFFIFNLISTIYDSKKIAYFTGIVMQIEKALTNDRLRVSNVS